jgi:HlyD family secretion protein
VRLNATRAQGSGATFTVVVDIANTQSLLPYLTANLQFEINHSSNVLLVPNDALRGPSPAPTTEANVVATSFNDASATPPAAAPAISSQTNSADAASTPKQLATLASQAKKPSCRILVRTGDAIRPIDVQTGNSDGAMTEVVGDNVKEGMDIVLGDLSPSDGA